MKVVEGGVSLVSPTITNQCGASWESVSPRSMQVYWVQQPKNFKYEAMSSCLESGGPVVGGIA